MTDGAEFVDWYEERVSVGIRGALVARGKACLAPGLVGFAAKESWDAMAGGGDDEPEL